MKAQDLYLRIMDPAGKSPDIVCYHRVWDRDLFVANQVSRHANQDKEQDRRLVKLATEAEYRLANFYKPEFC